MMIIYKMSQRFPLYFHKECHEKKKYFMDKFLTNFNFSEFWITDFRHYKFPKILMGINMAKFQDFFVAKSAIQNSEKLK